MFDVLIASGTGLQVRPKWVTTSMLTHVLIIGLAVLATQGALEAPKVVVPEAMLLFVPKPEPPPPAPEPKTRPAPNLVVAEPPPRGFQTVAAPADIPNVIPPVDLNQKPLDPRDFTGMGVEGGVAEGVVGGTGVVAKPDQIYEATTVLEGFDPAVLLSQPAPKYPAVLSTAGFTGAVTLEFVIDTLGKVEERSLRVIESTHPGFEGAARVAITGALFRPAHLGAVPVRQLTRQRVRFVAAQ
jgi:periplasmic protein TonB